MLKKNNDVNKVIDEINSYITENMMKLRYKLYKSLFNSFISINSNKSSKNKIKIIRNFYFEFENETKSSFSFFNSSDNNYSLFEPLLSSEEKSKKEVIDKLKKNANKKLNKFDDIMLDDSNKKRLINFNIEISKYIYDIEDNNYYVENYFYCNNKLEKFNAKDFSNFIQFRNDYWKLYNKTRNIIHNSISLPHDYFNNEINLFFFNKIILHNFNQPI